MIEQLQNPKTVTGFFIPSWATCLLFSVATNPVLTVTLFVASWVIAIVFLVASHAGSAAVATVVISLGLADVVFVAALVLAAYGLTGSRGFGLCSGLELANWLHGWIDRPLTFDDLAAYAPGAPSIDLKMMVTNITISRPHCFPLRAGEELYVDPDDLHGLFPRDVIEAIRKLGPNAEQDGAKLVGLANPGLPIVFAVRASLSFPLLLSAIPAYFERKGHYERSDPLVRCADPLAPHIGHYIGAV
jgi:hypothetical protein